LTILGVMNDSKSTSNSDAKKLFSCIRTPLALIGNEATHW
jgi:hypothetical protein